jgi:predicted NBD/HSP70 family sugar kinase
MRLLTVDVGGTAVKAAVFRDGAIAEGPIATPRAEVAVPALADWIDRHFPAPVDGIAVAVPGFVGGDGRARYFGDGRWIEADLAAAIRGRRPGAAVGVWGDAEAAAAAGAGLAPSPRLHLTLGTGVGMAVLDETERIVRPHRDGCFIPAVLRLGDGMRVWEALSPTALANLEATHGRERACGPFAARLAALLGVLAPLFQPQAVTLSGGLLARLPALVEETARRLPAALPYWYAPAFGFPRLVGLPDPVHSGLHGLARLMTDR